MSLELGRSVLSLGPCPSLGPVGKPGKGCGELGLTDGPGDGQGGTEVKILGTNDFSGDCVGTGTQRTLSALWVFALAVLPTQGTLTSALLSQGV